MPLTLLPSVMISTFQNTFLNTEMLPVRNRSSTYSRFNNLLAHKFYSIGPELLPSRRKSVMSISSDYNDRVKEANY
jgi:hypothetical protein